MKLKSNVLHIVHVAACLLLLMACKPSVPEQYIQPDDMEDLLYDYHVARGMASTAGTDNSYQQHLYFEAVLKKHGVTHADFDSSLVYYYTRADRFSEIYKHVQDRLGDEAMDLGASSSEVERFTTQSLTGDTADIWEGNRQLMLLANRPYHLYQFSQKADTSYHAGDSFMMTMNNTYLSQKSNKQAIVYLAVTYQNDSTISQYMMLSNYGPFKMNVPAYEERVKDIRGFIQLGYRDLEAKSDEMCLLFLDQIRLIRFHKQKGASSDDGTPAKTDAPAPADTARSSNDTIIQRHVRKLGERPVPADAGMTRKDGMDDDEILRLRKMGKLNVNPNRKPIKR